MKLITNLALLAPAAFLLVSVSAALAQSAPAQNPDAYTRTEVMIPVRDGAKLHTVIFRPAGSETSGPPLPFLMQRTPYGVDQMSAQAIVSGKPELAASGYIFVYQDIRGRYGSTGTFVMNRPIVPHDHKTAFDETTDTRDTIDWMLHNVPNNSGKVGVLGISYPGFLAMMAGIDAHPAVKAISPQAPMTDVWMGDDFFHNGAFRETYGFDYVQELEAQKTDATVSSSEDQFTFFLEHVNFAGAAATAGMTQLPTASKFLNEPTYTKFWQDMAVERRLGKPEVPTLEVGGYWDQEDMWGTQAEYAALRANEKPNDPLHKVFMVLGPWNHGGWARGPGESLGYPPGQHSGANLPGFGQVTFGGQHTGEYYRRKIEAPFFEFYLKGKPGFDLQDTASFRTGENAWHRYAIWPPQEGFHPQRAYLAPQKLLSFQPPHGNNYNATAAAYVSDPADPIPYRHRPIQSTYGEGSTWRTWLAEDQRFISSRQDLANFSTPLLASDLTVTGNVVADLFAATTGTDADWIVKLIDVYPDDAKLGTQSGYQLMVAEEIFRGRYRHSFTTPEPVKPSEVVEYKWSLHGVDHTFLKGHRMRVEVQSTWFPLYDRNPQTFVPNIMTAPASAYQPETITIYASPKYPSHLDLPMANGESLP
jgi:putative CocE/NonD family hydrolase